MYRKGYNYTPEKLQNMSAMSDPGEIERALQMVGDLLDGRRQRYHVVVIGGSALNLLGLVSRATTDVDVLAFAQPDSTGTLRLRPPDEPFPPDLVAAVTTVAQDLGMDPRWLNAGPASQWKTGLPTGLAERVVWRDFGGLAVGLVSRYDLIFFKLYAAADDRGPTSVHFQDLVALRPTHDELERAGDWVRSQDPSPAFAKDLAEVLKHARTIAGRSR
ncbi:MAG: DUF6036 family nucleotidyltransferase [Gemmatimonadales bacterium]